MGERDAIAGAVRSRHGRRAWIYGLGLATGVLAGLVAVAYRLLASWLDALRTGAFPGPDPWRFPVIAAWVALTATAGAATAFMVRKAPLIKGSGIPQVKAALQRRLGMDWVRELPLKFLGGSLALGTGLSLGREGPSIQLGALVGAGVADLSGRTEAKRYLVTAGAAAGIAAAFNAPLAGVLFCLEELHRSFSPVMLTCSMVAAFAAHAVAWLLAGGESVFGFPVQTVLPLGLYPAIVVIGAACGLAGAGFNAAIVGAQKLWKAAVPPEWLRLVLAFIAGGLVAVAAPGIAGGGAPMVDLVAGGGIPLAVLAALAVGKFVFTTLSYGSGAPGGIFLPMLVIGAMLGGIGGRGLEAAGAGASWMGNCVMLGMVGFFTAVVRAPVTGAILIAEMSGSFAHFPALMLSAVVASLTASLLRSPPIYDTLLARLVAADGIPGTTPRGERHTIIHVPVLEGSVIDTCANAQALMPEGSVLVCVQRGEDESIPRPGMDIHPGDVLVMLVDGGNERDIRRRVAELAGARSGSVESER